FAGGGWGCSRWCGLGGGADGSARVVYGFRGGVDPACLAKGSARVASGAGPCDRPVERDVGDAEPVGGLPAGVAVLAQQLPLGHEVVAGPGAARVVGEAVGAAFLLVAGIAQAARPAAGLERVGAEGAVAHAGRLVFGTGANPAGRHTGRSTTGGGGVGFGLRFGRGPRGSTGRARRTARRSRFDLAAHARHRRLPRASVYTLSPVSSCSPDRQCVPWLWPARGAARPEHTFEQNRRAANVACACLGRLKNAAPHSSHVFDGCGFGCRPLRSARVAQDFEQNRWATKSMWELFGFLPYSAPHSSHVFDGVCTGAARRRARTAQEMEQNRCWA